MTAKPTVFVVDDDELARTSVCALVCSMGIPAEPFSSAEEFLDHYVEGLPGCLVTDVRMLGMSGLELQERLRELDIHLPVVVMTAYAKTPLTVRAIQGGAVTLLEKPCEDDELWMPSARRYRGMPRAAPRTNGAENSNVASMDLHRRSAR